MTIQQMLLGGSPSGYNLTRSLRTRASAGAYLNRTPAGVGNRKTFTLSKWIKRGTLGVNAYVFGAEISGGANGSYVYFTTSDTLQFYDYASGAFQFQLITTQVFRDPSAWYHIVVVSDTTQATAANRIKMYVNGVQITAFGTATYPSQNYDNSSINNTNTHYLGYTSSVFDGYRAEVNFIDGQALTPSSFGSTNALTGVWQPIPYVGTYGTNGFYLPFTDNSALTTSSNVGLGQDFSGNANYWETNNISITAGETYDSMTDVPTLTDATTANYAVLNPLDNLASTIVNGNLGFTTATTVAGNINSTIWASSGKWYYEVVTTNLPSEFNFGICSTASGQAPTSGRYGFDGNPFLIQNSAFNAGGFTFAANDVLGVAYDLDAGTIAAYKNNVLQDTLTGVPAGTYTPFVADSTSGATGCTGYINFGQRPFTYTPPTGFVALNTFNLPAATIVKGNTVMDATLYTGTGAALSVTNAAGFQPDLVWMKGRSGATDHAWYDSVRGVQNQLESNTTTAETAEATGLTAFGSGGFTVGALAQVNTSAATYVGWQWKGGGAAVSNTAGTITSQVSANASAGFSIATFFGTSANATVGHGLGVAPKFIVVKNRSSGAWYSYHVSSGAGNYLVLNSNAANAADTTAWNNTDPSSSVFYLGSNVVINPAATCVAYCWSEIDGFSKFGSYTGNGSADGPFVYTGFRPRWLMIKRTDSTSNWYIFDTARNTFNVMTDELLANSSNAEANNNRWIDCLSNGFKIRNDAASQINASGGTMVYAAFAENPFKNSLGR